MASIRRASLIALLAACTTAEPSSRRPTAPAPAAPAPAAPVVAAPVKPPAPPPTELVVAERDPGLAFLDADRKRKLMAAFGAVDAAIADEMKKQRLGGLAVGIVIDGDLAYAKGFGVTDLETKQPPTADTVYRIGSISKSFTGMALLSLRDEGALGLDDPLARWIPEAARLVYPTRDARAITLRQLLTHSSGLPRQGPYDAGAAPTADAIAKSLVGLPLDNAPGLVWSYSNLAFSLLGIVVGRAAHAPFHDVVAQRILRPLGMTSTYWDHADIPAGRLATVYQPGPNGLARGRDPARLGAGDGAGGIFSTVRDMAQYAALQLSAYPPRSAPDDGPIRRASIREAHSTGVLSGAGFRVEVAPRRGERAMDYDARLYGFGWEHAQTCDFDDLVMHGGAIDSYRADLSLLTTRGVAIVALTNFGDANMHAFSTRILRALADTGALTRRAAPPSSDTDQAMRQLLAVYNTWDETAYKAMLEPGRTPFPEEKDELAGYHALHGACASFAPADPDDRLPTGPLDGHYKLRCERGSFEMLIQLGAKGHKIAGFIGRSRDIAPPPDIKRALDGLASLISRWDDATYRRLVAKSAQSSSAKDYFSDLRAARTSCKLATAVHEGFDWAAELSCERAGTLRLQIAMTKSSPAQLERYDFRPMPGCPVR